MRDNIILENGSVQNIPNFPEDLKEIYIDKKYASDATEESPFGEQVPFKKYINFIESQTLFLQLIIKLFNSLKKFILKNY